MQPGAGSVLDGARDARPRSGVGSSGGLTLGSRGPLITATALKIFSGKRVGTIYGMNSIGSGLGSGFGAWFGGVIHDHTHGYNALIVFALINVILGMLPFLVVPALRR